MTITMTHRHFLTVALCSRLTERSRHTLVRSHCSCASQGIVLNVSRNWELGDTLIALSTLKCLLSAMFKSFDKVTLRPMRKITTMFFAVEIFLSVRKIHVLISFCEKPNWLNASTDWSCQCFGPSRVHVSLGSGLSFQKIAVLQVSLCSHPNVFISPSIHKYFTDTHNENSFTVCTLRFR